MQRVLAAPKVSIGLIKTMPPKLLLAASGEVPTSGWKKPSLEPWFYVNPPEDGVQDFDFVAKPPIGIVAEVISPVEASLIIERSPFDYWGPGRPLNGVRVHSRTNIITESYGSRSFAGYVTLPDDLPTPIDQALRRIRAGDDDPFPVAGRRVDPTHLLIDLLDKSLRVYRTGDGLTKDLRPDRANIELDPGSGRIVDIWFG